MKVRITNLKGPWPTGAKVGDVVGIPGDVIPGWAVGKCVQAEDDTEAQHEYEPRERASEPRAVGPISLTPAQQKELVERFDALERERSDLCDQISAQGQTIQQLTDNLQASVQEESALREQLAAAQNATSAEKARAEELQAKLVAAEQAAVDAAASAGGTAKGGKK